MKQEKIEIHKDENLLEFIPDKYLKKAHSGHTFFAFISNESLFIVGYIRGYLNIKDTSEISEEFEIYDSQVIEVKSNFKYPIWKVKNIPNYKPISVSVNRFSLTALYVKNEIKNILREEFKEFKELFEEVKNNLRTKGFSFQKYFLDYLTNDYLYQGGSNYMEENRYAISEGEFKDKFFEIITSSNSDKLSFLINKFLDKLRHTGISVNGKIEITEVHQIIYSEAYPHTKVLMIGEIVNALQKNIKSLDIYENWKKIYDKNFLIETPLVLIPLKQIEIGDNHVLMLTVEGEIYSYGDGQSGITGNGIFTYHFKPVKVKFQYNTVSIERIAAAGRHSLAIDSNQIIYSWGSGKNGRLGHDNEKDQHYPKAIESISNNKIIYCSAGDTYSCAISQEHSLFTWGSGEFGRLGHEGNTDEFVPKEIQELDSKFYVAYCNHYSMVATTIKKEVYFFGAKSLFLKNDNNKKENSENLILVDITENIRKLEYTNKQETEYLHVSTGYQFISCVTKEENGEDAFKIVESNNK